MIHAIKGAGLDFTDAKRNDGVNQHPPSYRPTHEKNLRVLVVACLKATDGVGTDHGKLVTFLVPESEPQFSS